MLPSPILSGTSDHVARWTDTAKQQRLTIEENALTDAGDAEPKRSRPLFVNSLEPDLTT